LILMENLKTLAAPDWFSLGDQDMATHLERTRLLNEGWTLSQVIRHFCQSWGISHTILPMTDQVVSTRIETNDNQNLDFQEYFVHQRWQPVVKKIIFNGSETSRLSPELLDRVSAADLVVICPSNPLLSIDPILSVPGIRDQIMKKPVLAVSPIIGGKAVKGPLAKMIQELFSVEPSANWIAEYYQRNLRLDGLILDHRDMHEVELVTRKGIICKPGNTIMTSKLDRNRLAQEVLEFGQDILKRKYLP